MGIDGMERFGCLLVQKRIWNPPRNGSVLQKSRMFYIVPDNPTLVSCLDGMRRKITDEIWQQVETAFAAGVVLREIARNMGIPEGSVSREQNAKVGHNRFNQQRRLQPRGKSACRHSGKKPWQCQCSSAESVTLSAWRAFQSALSITLKHVLNIDTCGIEVGET